MTRIFIAILILLLPLIEIAGFVIVGRQIGLLATLLLVIASAVIGMAILRRQGFQALSKLRQQNLPRDLPAEKFFDTAMVLLAGLLLIVPGFFTDIIAILVLVPFVRTFIARRLAARAVVVNFEASADPRGSRPQQPRTIDLDTDDYNRDEPR